MVVKMNLLVTVICVFILHHSYALTAVKKEEGNGPKPAIGVNGTHAIKVPSGIVAPAPKNNACDAGKLHDCFSKKREKMDSSHIECEKKCVEKMSDTAKKVKANCLDNQKKTMQENGKKIHACIMEKSGVYATPEALKQRVGRQAPSFHVPPQGFPEGGPHPPPGGAHPQPGGPPQGMPPKEPPQFLKDIEGMTEFFSCMGECFHGAHKVGSPEENKPKEANKTESNAWAQAAPGRRRRQFPGGPSHLPNFHAGAQPSFGGKGPDDLPPFGGKGHHGRPLFGGMGQNDPLHECFKETRCEPPHPAVMMAAGKDCAEEHFKHDQMQSKFKSVCECVQKETGKNDFKCDQMPQFPPHGPPQGPPTGGFPGGPPNGNFSGGASGGFFPGGFPGGPPNGNFSGGFPGGPPHGNFSGGFPGVFPGGFPGGPPNGNFSGGASGGFFPGGFPGGPPHGNFSGGFSGGFFPGGFPGGSQNKTGPQPPQPPKNKTVAAVPQRLG